MASSIRKILQKFISDRIPQKQTNIFWQMFNGIEAMFTQLEYFLKIRKRESNMLTANYLSSLRNHAAHNGYEPILKIPANGIIQLTIKPKLFNRVGYPLYLPPYSVFKNKETGINYYFNSDKTLRLDSNTQNIPIVEGEVVQTSFVSTGAYIERFYINSNDVANGSITVSVNDKKFVELKSFYDNENVNDNKQFIVKYSNNPQKPIIIYIKGTSINDQVQIIYKVTCGELGNISNKASFETNDIIDSNSVEIVPEDDEIEIFNLTGFRYGSNGTDENSLRAAIGYNHGQNLLYDSITYRDFINKFSTLLLQNVFVSEERKTINHIYLSKKQSVNENLGIGVIQQYKSIIQNQTYILSQEDKQNLDKLIGEYEYCLSSHILHPSIINKYAIQITLENVSDMNSYNELIQILIYKEFSKFLYDKFYVSNFDVIFNDFMKANNIKFSYTLFSQKIETQKLQNSRQYETEYIIKHENELPILCGDFNIAGIDYKPVKLFFDVNIISEESLS